MKNLMKWKNLLLMLFVGSVIIVSSCKDDKDNGIVEGDKTELNALIAEAEALANAAKPADYPQTAIDAFKSKVQIIKTKL